MKTDKDEGTAKRDLSRGFEGRRMDLGMGHFSYWVRPGVPRFYRPGRTRDWLGSITAAHGKAEEDLLTAFEKYRPFDRIFDAAENATMVLGVGDELLS